MNTELNIVKAIKSKGLQTVVDKYSLLMKRQNGKVLLKYHQINSHKFRTLESVRETRGLILNESTFEVVSYMFKRFFNVGEQGQDKVDLKTAKVFKKEDGSLIGIYWDSINNKWCAQTSGTIEADGQVAYGEMSFKELTEKALGYNLDEFQGNKDYTYIFELCSPYNIVVTQHSETFMKCLGIRNLKTLQELSWSEVCVECEKLGIDVVESYDLDIKNLKNIADNLPAQEEGYVVCDANFNRYKVKNATWCVLHHKVTGNSVKSLFTVVKTNELDEYLAVAPQHKGLIMPMYNWFKDMVSRLESVVNYMESLDCKSRKDFSSKVFPKFKEMGIPNKFTGYIFSYFFDDKKITAWEYLSDKKDKMLYKMYSGK